MKKTGATCPWRQTSDPYAIWISETMLQQTQVRTVLPYYERFLDTFPTVEALARAPLARVLRLWSGLGYYRRAENLSAAARQIVRAHHGELPQDYAQLRALAGIGDYTAGAILSIAFQRALSRHPRQRPRACLAGFFPSRTKPPCARARTGSSAKPSREISIRH